MYPIFDLVLGFKKNRLLILGLEELLRRGFQTEVKLSPDCPLVEVLKEPSAGS